MALVVAVATATGRAIAEQVRMPFKLIDGMLARMKNEQLVYYYADAPMNDYVYQLTDVGRERARPLRGDPEAATPGSSKRPSAKAAWRRRRRCSGRNRSVGFRWRT